MSEYLSINPLREEFLSNDEEYRYAYAEDFLNTYIATQIKVLRDLRGLTQKGLAEAIGTKQPGIARLENVNYSKWNTETLKRVARALGVRLKITFETFGSLLEEDANFSRKALERPSFEEDEAFKEDEPATKPTSAAANEVLLEASHIFPGLPENSTAARLQFLPLEYPAGTFPAAVRNTNKPEVPMKRETIPATAATQRGRAEEGQTLTRKVAVGTSRR